MRIIRSFTKNPLTIAILLIAFLNLSCNQDDMIESYTDNSLNEKYSGEDIMKGLFFFQNNISDDVSFLHDFKNQLYNLRDSKEIDVELKNFSEVATNYINTYRPSFFNEFQSAMYSDNYYLIKNKLDECAIMIGNSLAMSDKYSDAFQFAELKNSPEFMEFISSVDLTTIEGQQQLNGFLNANPEFRYDENGQKVAIPIFAGAVAVVYVAVAAVSIAAALYSVVTKAAYWDPFGQSVGKNELSKEIIVKELSNYFLNN